MRCSSSNEQTIQLQLRLKQGVLHLLETYIANTKEINPLLKLNCLQKMLELDEFNEQYMLLLLQFLIKQKKIGMYALL